MDLQEIIEEMTEELLFARRQADWIRAFERISSRYRAESGSFLQTDDERKVYLFTRLPATFAAVCKVLEEMYSRNPSIEINSFLDVGAGPGTGLWAASQCFSTLRSAVLLEKDPLFMQIGQEIAARSSSVLIQNATWQRCNVEKSFTIEPADLALFSYSIGEVKESAWSVLCQTVWEATRKALVIIEPGTPKGYARLMKLRDFFLSRGAYLWAPCPHSLKCPLPEGDWCHFSVRVSRTSLHRKLKSADLGYEDEKFIYMIFGKEAVPPFQGRIIRKPLHHSGWMECTTCEQEGIKYEIFTKKEGDKYREKKKLEWGDSF